MTIRYTFLYIDIINSDGQILKKKQFFSEPNPNFNKDLRETASRKYLYNLPAREMMSRLIREFSLDMRKNTTTNLDTAFYFGPFKNNEKIAQGPGGEHSQKISEGSSVAIFNQKASSHMNSFRDGCIKNSNLDDLTELMQDFSTASDVYFGWKDYYLCSYDDFRNYVMNKSDRMLSKMPTAEEMRESDIYLKREIEAYEMLKRYNYWLSWIPFGLGSGLIQQERTMKQNIDDYLKKKLEENDKKVEDHDNYEEDLDKLLCDIDKNLNELKMISPNAKFISLLMQIL